MPLSFVVPLSFSSSRCCNLETKYIPPLKPNDEQKETVLGYQILETLPAGGMAEVFAAGDPKTG
jgi:hypothetical protein